MLNIAQNVPLDLNVLLFSLYQLHVVPAITLLKVVSIVILFHQE